MLLLFAVFGFDLVEIENEFMNSYKNTPNLTYDSDVHILSFDVHTKFDVHIALAQLLTYAPHTSDIPDHTHLKYTPYVFDIHTSSGTQNTYLRYTTTHVF